MTTKVGIVGVGVVGTAVARALQEGIKDMELTALCDPVHRAEFAPALYKNMETLVEECDLIVEALPASALPELMKSVFHHDKDMVLISSAALLIHPKILEQNELRTGRIIVPSGALCGIDGVIGLKQMGIKSAKIASTKKPKGFSGAPFIVENDIDLDAINSKTLIFEGNALEAAKGFPANVNVAATLSLAGIGGENTTVEVWADPDITGNTHEITVESEFSRLNCRVENTPDPNNPKTSMLTAMSIIAILKGMTEPLAIL